MVGRSEVGPGRGSAILHTEASGRRDDVNVGVNSRMLERNRLTRRRHPTLWELIYPLAVGLVLWFIFPVYRGAIVLLVIAMYAGPPMLRRAWREVKGMVGR